MDNKLFYVFEHMPKNKIQWTLILEWIYVCDSYQLFISRSRWYW